MRNIRSARRKGLRAPWYQCVSLASKATLPIVSFLLARLFALLLTLLTAHCRSTAAGRAQLPAIVRGATAVAETFAGRAQGMPPALIDGVVGAV